MLINHFERMERLVSHIFFNVWYNWCINTVTLKIQGGARAPPCPNLPKPMPRPPKQMFVLAISQPFLNGMS